MNIFTKMKDRMKKAFKVFKNLNEISALDKVTVLYLILVLFNVVKFGLFLMLVTITNPERTILIFVWIIGYMSIEFTMSFIIMKTVKLSLKHSIEHDAQIEFSEE